LLDLIADVCPVFADGLFVHLNSSKAKAACSKEESKVKQAEYLASLVFKRFLIDRFQIKFQDLTSSRFGGAIQQSSDLRSQSEIADLKFKASSNVLPIGLVCARPQELCSVSALVQMRSGFYDHRALLYKVLCDQVEIPCELIRMEYSKAFNLVHLPGCAFELWYYFS
jgi:hypothetical protein